VVGEVDAFDGKKQADTVVATASEVDEDDGA